MHPNDIELEMTCGACPEQYDAYCDGQRVGYLRLRHGVFRVEAPDIGGDTVFWAEPKGDGAFESDERAGYLAMARAAIAAYHNTQRGEFTAPDAELEAWRVLLQKAMMQAPDEIALLLLHVAVAAERQRRFQQAEDDALAAGEPDAWKQAFTARSQSAIMVRDALNVLDMRVRHSVE